MGDDGEHEAQDEEIVGGNGSGKGDDRTPAAGAGPGAPRGASAGQPAPDLPADDDFFDDDDEPGADLVWEEGVLVSDTEETVRGEGTRSGVQHERRLLFQGERVYVEVRLPLDGPTPAQGCWLYGQFVVPDDMAHKYDLPMLAVVQGEEGVTGAMRMTANGEFALPFRGRGEQVLEFEPREAPVGPAFRIRFAT